MSTYRPSAFDTEELIPDRSGAPDGVPRTPWSPVRATRGRVARPLVDVEEPNELLENVHQVDNLNTKIILFNTT